MKYVALTGGLGNQMFIYAFCEELRARGEKTVIFVQHRFNQKAYGQQGYELEKLFLIRRYDGSLSVVQDFLLTLYSQLLRFFPVIYRERLFRMVGIHVVSVPENFIFYQKVFCFKSKNELFRGTWQSERYFEHVKANIRKTFVFNMNLLSEQTSTIALQMRQETSVSIHIRRGDYLSDQYVDGFTGVCTVNYYENAIEQMQDQHENPCFYVFTDDKEWANEHFQLKNAVYVYHNIGDNSWQDMYLMSQCKHNIIANSSFSWWGAWLNNNPDKIVVAPKLWWRLFEKDDVVPGDWIRI